MQLKIYDLLGNEVSEILNGEQTEGSHKINFNDAGLSSGIYFYKITAGKYSETRKMTVLKQKHFLKAVHPDSFSSAILKIN